MLNFSDKPSNQASRPRLLLLAAVVGLIVLGIIVGAARSGILTSVRLLPATPKPKATPRASATPPSVSPAPLSFVPGELIVGFAPTASTADVQATYSQHGFTEKEKLRKVPKAGNDATDPRLVRVAGDLDTAIRALSKNPKVRYVEKNYLFRSDALPNDPSFSQLWGLHNTGQNNGTPDADIDAPEAWESNKGSKSVIVGILDTGLDYNHPDLAANVWSNPGETPGDGIDNDKNGYVDDVRGMNAITNGGDPMDDAGHGTHVAGIVGAVGNNGAGITGVNWNVTLLPCKFQNSAGGSLSNAVECFTYINYMKNIRGLNIVATNNSWGGASTDFQPLRDAMSGLDQPGMSPILHVVSAGNSGANLDAYPAYPASSTLPNVVTVAATDKKDVYATSSYWGSNYGATSVDLAAPGVNIYSTYLSGGYTLLSGTSTAAPHVAGAVAMVALVNPGLSATALRQQILASVDPIGSISGNTTKSTVTNGRLNVMRAIGSCY